MIPLSVKMLIFSKILSSLLDFFPFSLEDEKLKASKTIAHGFNEKNIIIFEVVLLKDRHIRLFLGKLKEKMGVELRQKIISQAGTRLDDTLDFFLRFDKKSWMEGKKLVLTDLGECFHIKINVAAFPKKKEIALSIIKSIFQNQRVFYPYFDLKCIKNVNNKIII